MKTAVEHLFQGTTTPIASYSSTLTNLGTLIKQYTGAAETDKFAGPLKIAVARPLEQSTAITGAFPHAISWSATKHWIFLADNSAAALTRRIILYEYDLTTGLFTWKGFITLNWSALTGNKTIRGLRALYTTYSTGTVAVSGTSVTGTGTTFTSNKLAVGGRIGFGSTNPTAITNWYEISAIGSETGITLGATAGTIGAGSAYVIEELRIAVSVTNVTTTNGGLFVAKGLNYSTFTTGGTNIAEATTADNLRLIYWLADASTVLNITADGLAVDSSSSLTSHFAWVVDGTTTARIFKYDLRATLAGLAAGKSTSAFVLATGTSATLTGTSSQLNNGRIVTCSHGPGAGVKSLYFATTTRIYRVAESGITSTSTTFLSDAMVEIPPGSTSTFPLTSAFISVDYSDSIDRFIVMSSGAAGVRSYITKYNTTSDQFDFIFLVDNKQQDQSLADSDSTPFPSISALGISIWSEAGIFYIVRNSTVAATNQLYAVPVGADMAFVDSTNQYLITPSISTPNAIKYYRMYVNEDRIIGDTILGLRSEGYKVYYRVSGISDDSGSWIEIEDTGDLTGVGVGSSIQFAIAFRMIGPFCIPSRIYGLTLVYEDSSTDSHYNPSLNKSVAATRVFAWRQVTAWGSNIPNMRIRIYNADTSALVLDDTVSSSVSGDWQYSTDGTTWNTWSAAADTVGNYIRYTADSLPSSIVARALLTQ